MAAGPADFDRVELACQAKAEVYAHVVVRVVAGAAADFVNEEARAGSHGDSSADGVAVGAKFLGCCGQGSADEVESDPVVCAVNFIDEEAGRGVHVTDYRREPAVVPQIADGQAARRIKGSDAGTGVDGNVGEGAVAVV